MESEDGAGVGAALEPQALHQVSHLAGTGGDMGVASDIGGGVCVEAAELRGQLYGNLALSFLKLGQPEKALEITTQGVARAPDSGKLLLRHGQALAANQHLTHAVSVLSRAQHQLDVAPLVAKALNEVKSKMRTDDKQVKSVYTKMMSAFKF